jgi:glycosyltransferase involved in cell wall biosynthesis
MDVGKGINMKVFIEPAEKKDRTITKVVNALKKHAPPGVELVSNQNDAEFIVLHINGRLQRTQRKVGRFNKLGVKYAMMQYCLKSTMAKKASDWIDLWQGADLVWSYFDLPAISLDEGVDFSGVNFYRSPLGVDPEIYHPRKVRKDYLIMSCSQNYLSECAREIIRAAQDLGAPVAHLGPYLKKTNVDYYINISDDKVAELYSQCKYVPGLRRTEGFEMPVPEGLMCGARPIVFDKPHYTDWFGDWAITIPETNRDQIIEDLKVVLKMPYVKVTPEEIEEAKKAFDWKTIVNGFWERL